MLVAVCVAPTMQPALCFRRREICAEGAFSAFWRSLTRLIFGPNVYLEPSIRARAGVLFYFPIDVLCNVLYSGNC